MTCSLTVILTFHREGYLARSALRSALNAARQARDHGVPCKIVAVIDRGDELTREHVFNFENEIESIYEVEFADVSLARNCAIEHVDTRYLATLDGDDLFSTDWLWKGVHYLEEIADDYAIGHAQVRMTFGSDLFGLVQIPSDSHLFHPLYLISTWPYATDVIAPSWIFQKYPFLPYNKRKGFGAEDWFWNCESLLNSIKHVIIPHTSYFYRRQANHMSLGMVPNITFPPTRLFDKMYLREVMTLYPHSAALLLSHETAVNRGTIEKWDMVPRWLEQDVKEMCDIDLQCYSLFKNLSTIPIQTQGYHPAVGQCYLELMAMIKSEQVNVVIFLDNLDSDSLSLIERFIHHCQRADDSRPNVCLIKLALTASGTGHELSPGNDNHDSCSLTYLNLGDRPAFKNLYGRLKTDLISRFLLQAAPRLVVNLNSGFIDECVGDFGKAIAGVTTMVVRICRGQDVPLLDPVLHAEWKGLERSKGLYSHVVCENYRVSRWLQRYFNGCEIAVHACDPEDQPERNRLFGDKLFLLLKDGPGLMAGDHSKPATIEYFQKTGGHTSSFSEREIVDVSCIMTLHNEGHYFNQTYQCLSRICRDAEKQEICTEFIIVTDCADDTTRRVVALLVQSNPELITIAVCYGDPAMARGAGIERSRGRYIAIFTGTDMVSPTWLTLALHCAENSQDPTIYHPELIIQSGVDKSARLQPDMRSVLYDERLLAFSNVWHPCLLASRDVFNKVPYSPATKQHGGECASWHWNCETVMAGFCHQTVDQTAIYQRPCGRGAKRSHQLDSPWKSTLAPSRFFSPHGSPLYRSRRLPLRLLQLLYCYAVAKKIVTSQVLLATERITLSKWDPSFISTRYSTPTPSGWFFLTAITVLTLPKKRVHRVMSKRNPGNEHAADHQQDMENVVKRIARLIGWKKARSWINTELDSGKTKPFIQQNTLAARKAAAYCTLTRNLSEYNPTHIFIAPSLRLGGAEQSMLFCIDVLLQNKENHVLIINTDDADKHWLNRARLPERCRCQLFGVITDTLSMEDKVEILTRVLVNTPARCLHVMYSWVGWQVIARSARALSKKHDIFVSIFDIPPVTSHTDHGYAGYLGPLLPFLSGIFTDNSRAAEALASYYGITSDKIHSLRHPVKATDRFSSMPDNDSIVLWAGRVDYDKRPELLIEIAAHLPDRVFHVYGRNILSSEKYIHALKKRANIHYKGPFTGFDSIPHAPYGVYLHTASREGMPNVILEAMQSGLLVVAPDVGGIAEVVGNERGILIEQHQSPYEYVQALENVLSKPSGFHEMAQKGQLYVKNHYNIDTFSHALKNIPGYVSAHAPR